MRKYRPGGTSARRRPSRTRTPVRKKAMWLGWPGWSRSMPNVSIPTPRTGTLARYSAASDVRHTNPGSKPSTYESLVLTRTNSPAA
ncbi:MAG: hypothetical protein AB1774_05855 [Bacillota bacterium]